MKIRKVLAFMMALVLACSAGPLTGYASEETVTTDKYDEAEMIALLEEHQISVGGVLNTRDMGGYYTEDGRYKVRTGMIFRGATLDNITASGVDTLLNTYHIKTQLDLRTEEEIENNAPLGDSVNYINISAAMYSHIILSENHATFAKEIQTFAKEENYPIYFHCQVGKDRTGTLALLLNALLGVSEADLIADYQLTFYSENGVGAYAGSSLESLMPNVKDLLLLLNAFQGETLAENAENFLIGIGVTQEEIDSIRSIMLEPVEGYEEPVEQDADYTDHTVVYIIAGGAVCIAAVVLAIVLIVKKKKAKTRGSLS